MGEDKHQCFVALCTASMHHPRLDIPGAGKYSQASRNGETRGKETRQCYARMSLH